jgi:hypothetical protein
VGATSGGSCGSLQRPLHPGSFGPRLRGGKMAGTHRRCVLTPEIADVAVMVIALALILVGVFPR